MKYQLLGEIEEDARGYKVRFRVANTKTYSAGIHNVVYFTECMIFPVVHGIIDYGTEVYCKRDIGVTKENLLMCISEFCKELDDEA